MEKRHTVTHFSKPKNTRETLKRLASYLLRYKKLFLGLIFFLLLNAIMVFLPSMITADLVDKLIKLAVAGTNKNNNLSLAVNTLVKYMFVFGFIYIFDVISDYIFRFLALRLSQRVVNKIRKDLFSNIKYLPVRYFDFTPHGEIMSRFTNDIDNISDALNDSLPQLINGIGTLLGVFFIMIFLSPAMSIINFIMLFLMFRASKKILSLSRESFRSQQKNLGELNSFIEETMEGQKVVKAFCYEANIKKNFDIYNKNYCEAAKKAQFYSGIIMPITFNLNNISYAILTALGSVFILFKLFTIGKLTSFLQLARLSEHPIGHLSSQITTIQAALAGAERIFEVMDKSPEDNFNNKSNSNSDKSPGLDLNKNNLLGVEFKNVIFGYEPEKIILNNISFVAESGKKIALVGSTGAGKTTITNLITRFYDINSGEIKINNINIKELDLKDLRSSIGMVLQDTHLFQNSILENIRYGRLDATDQECIQAAKLANADLFIKKMPDGYKTIIYNDGENLSQGQRQLLNIARVAVSHPKILILDEATSSVDTRTEKLIQTGMNNLMAGRTTFIIAHRLSTIRSADIILVIENGKIIENGTHDELLKNHGRYYQLCVGQYELN